MTAPVPQLATRLRAEHIDELLLKCTGWAYSPDRGGTITREFLFADFRQAFGFMAQVALMAEKRNHHPEWSNLYNRVSITLTTHDVSGLSMKDIKFAQLADRTYALYDAQPA